jgi:hypothetical protein
MRIIRSLFAILSLTIGLQPIKLSAQNPYASAVDYNDFIVEQQNAIGSAIINFNTIFGDENLNEEMALAGHGELLSVIQQSIDAMEVLEAFEGNTELRNSALELFRFYDRIVQKQYLDMLYIMLKVEITSDDEELMGDLLRSITDEEAGFDLRFQAAQNAFAEKYNFKLIENEMQEEIDGE